MATIQKIKSETMSLNTDNKVSKVFNPEKMFYIFNNMYSNIIGSIVRELASNAIDANTEAKSDKPIIIELKGNNFIVKDFGKGISPEVAENHYFAYLNSTKEGDDEQIGMWGLGAKCPLGYTDSLIVETIYNGIYYKYIQYKNEDSLPCYELIETRKEENEIGTKITVPIKNIDKEEFHNEMINLIFNKNIYLKSDYKYINNEIKIYEYKTFKLREKIQNKYRDRQNTFILLNNIVYPIDNEKINTNIIYDLPIGIKFNINELQPTPTRETIYYTKESIKFINDRINEVKEELTEIFEKQYNKEYDNFEELWSNLNKDNYYIDLGEEKFNIYKELLSFKIKDSNICLKKYNDNLLFYNLKNISINSGGISKKEYYYRKYYLSKFISSKENFYLIFDNSIKKTIDANLKIKELKNYFFYEKSSPSFKVLRNFYKNNELDKYPKEDIRKLFKKLKELEDNFINKYHYKNYTDFIDKQTKTNKKTNLKSIKITELKFDYYKIRLEYKYYNLDYFKNNFLYIIGTTNDKENLKKICKSLRYLTNIKICILNKNELKKINKDNIIIYNKDMDLKKDIKFIEKLTILLNVEHCNLKYDYTNNEVRNIILYILNTFCNTNEFEKILYIFDKIGNTLYDLNDIKKMIIDKFEIKIEDYYDEKIIKEIEEEMNKLDKYENYIKLLMHYEKIIDNLTIKN